MGKFFLLLDQLLPFFLSLQAFAAHEIASLNLKARPHRILKESAGANGGGEADGTRSCALGDAIRFFVD